MSISLLTIRSEHHLALTLMPRYPNDLITYGVVKVNDGKITKHDDLTERNFILMACGEMRCESNPELENLFEKHNIPNCTTIYNQPFRTYTIDCPLLERIYKVRYDKVPGKEKGKDGVNDPGEGGGWASWEQHPSDAQMKILEAYGIKNIGDAIYGDSLWHFLQDINNAAWVNNYRAN